MMNYDKKRKRQSGRQARQIQDCYSIWIDEENKIHSKVVKARKRPTGTNIPLEFTL